MRGCMKAQHAILILLPAMVLAGCSSYRGGSSDDEQYSGTYGYGAGAYPEPAGSPTFRPGMNPQDIRDPNALTRPEPPTTAPQVSPGAPPSMSPGATP